MADIFDEINEELKHDRMTALWRRYGKYVIAFVIAVVAGVSLTQGYSYYTQTVSYTHLTLPTKRIV